MALLIQIPLLAMVALINYLVLIVFHGGLWLAFILTICGLSLAWFCYLVYQVKHPDWWPPWDEGLPQGTRMMNAFIPVLGIYIGCLIMFPVLQRAKQDAQRQQKQAAAASVSKSNE